MPEFTWDDTEAKRKLRELLAQRMLRAGVFLQGEIRKSINVGNPTGKFPSAEGEPPRKVSAGLFMSIAVEGPEFDGNILRIRVGTNKVYAPRLEFGFFGVDARGRNVHQGARPFLRPGLTNNQAKLGRIALTGAL